MPMAIARMKSRQKTRRAYLFQVNDLHGRAKSILKSATLGPGMSSSKNASRSSSEREGDRIGSSAAYLKLSRRRKWALTVRYGK